MEKYVDGTFFGPTHIFTKANRNFRKSRAMSDFMWKKLKTSGQRKWKRGVSLLE